LNHDELGHQSRGAAGVLAIASRLFVYALTTALVFQSVVVIATSGYADLLGSEYGPVECLQFFLALTAGSILFAAARASDATATLLKVTALVAWFAAAREADRFLTDLVFSDANKIVMTMVALVAALVAIRGRHSIGAELAKFLTTSGFYLLFCGWLVIVVYAQIIGQKELWQAVMGDSYLRAAKNTLEELPELLGYLLLVFGSIETWVFERRCVSKN